MRDPVGPEEGRIPETLEALIERMAMQAETGMLAFWSQGAPHSWRQALRGLLSAHREALARAVEGLPAFHPVDRGLATQVSDNAKKPMFGTNYLEREAVLALLRPQTDTERTT